MPPKAYHGGDLKGIQDHLPYLKDLGVTTLWLNPIFDNDNISEGYHGYGATDLYAVEDHFGTLARISATGRCRPPAGNQDSARHGPEPRGTQASVGDLAAGAGWLHGTTANHINTDYDYPPVTDPHAVEKNYRSALDGWFANVLPDLAQENPLVAAVPAAKRLLVDGNRRRRRLSHRYLSLRPAHLLDDVPPGSAIHVSQLLCRRRGLQLRADRWSPILPAARRASTASTPT